MPKKLLLISLFAFAIATPVRAGDSVAMIEVADLRDEARVVRAQKLIMVLEFSSDYCAYCRRLENLFLLPMQRNSEYDKKILIRSVPLNGFESLIDFNGRSLSTAEFASRYDVSLTPTLLFLNAAGKEMSDKLVGIWSEDFYGGFIDSRIDEAREKLGHVGFAETGLQ